MHLLVDGIQSTNFHLFLLQVAQTVALELEIPMEKIRIKPTYNFITPNSSTTGGSITSEIVCHVSFLKKMHF